MSETTKLSYAVPCASAFRDRVLALAERRGVNPGDLARSILLVVPPAIVAAVPDPGEPAERDRETITLKSGPGKGKPWRRKPRLQVRLPSGQNIPTIRKALALALAIEAGDSTVSVKNVWDPPQPDWKKVAKASEERASRLQVSMATLAFDPLPDGVGTRGDALYVFGFPPRSRPDKTLIRSKYRMLAAIFHPDSEFGDHVRMSQVNQAMALLRDSF